MLNCEKLTNVLTTFYMYSINKCLISKQNIFSRSLNLLGKNVIFFIKNCHEKKVYAKMLSKIAIKKDPIKLRSKLTLKNNNPI